MLIFTLQALKQDEQSLGYHFKGKTEIELLDDDKVSGSDAIEIRVDFEDVPRNMNIVWKHSVDKEGSLIHPISKVINIQNMHKITNEFEPHEKNKEVAAYKKLNQPMVSGG